MEIYKGSRKKVLFLVARPPDTMRERGGRGKGLATKKNSFAASLRSVSPL